ncbi:MAG TPA: CHAT domain-containing protein [Trichocoleus sp.]
MGSLREISAELMSGLMVEFYQQLHGDLSKSEALRQAQLPMLHGKIYAENGNWPLQREGRLYHLN